MQFYLLESYDLTFLYFLVFIPFQVMAIYTWLKADKADAPVMLPSYMKGTARIWAIVVFLSIVLLDYALITYWIAPESGALIKIVNGVLIGSSVLANFLLIWKKIDSWIFWIIYSLDGLLLAFLINNTFNVLLFIFFLVINGITTVSWMRDYYRSRASL